jgi:hypothetical protein
MKMNTYDHQGAGEAVVRYLDHDFQVMKPGTYVICAVTEKHIPLSELTYWSVLRQEPYYDVRASVTREQPK